LTSRKAALFFVGKLDLNYVWLQLGLWFAKTSQRLVTPGRRP
jgi:hypothetical protein